MAPEADAATAQRDAQVGQAGLDAGGIAAADGGGLQHAPDAAVVVHDCAALPAPGTWEEITPPQFLEIPGSDPHGDDQHKQIAQAIDVNPIDQSVYASGFTWTGHSTGVLKSIDCGAHWTKVSTGKNGDALDSGAQWAMHVDPTQAAGTIYIANGYGGPPSLFKSINGGVDWENLFPPGSEVDKVVPQGAFTQAIGMDPHDPQHLVVTFHENCNAPYDPMCMAETQDGGGHWQLFKGPKEATGWSEASSVTVLDKTSWLFVTPQFDGVFYTADSGKSWKHVQNGPAYGNYSGSAYLTPDGNAAYLGIANNGMFVSRKDAQHALGASWTLLPGSVQGSTVIGDGESLFTSWGWDTSGQPFYTLKLSDVGNAAATWTHMTSPPIDTGSGGFAYDATHHIVYSPNRAGVWRLVTR